MAHYQDHQYGSQGKDKEQHGNMEQKYSRFDPDLQNMYDWGGQGHEMKHHQGPHHGDHHGHHHGHDHDRDGHKEDKEQKYSPFDPDLQNMYDWGGRGHEMKHHHGPHHGHHHGHHHHGPHQGHDHDRDGHREDNFEDGTLLLIRFQCDRGRNVDECKKALIRSKSTIENFHGKVCGVASDVYAKEVNAWPESPKMSICGIWFDSIRNAEHWAESDTLFKRNDFLDGIKSIAIPLKERPRFGYNTFLLTEFDIQYADEFKDKFSSHVAAVLGRHNCQPLCAFTTHPKHVKGGWYHERPSRHPAVTISCFRAPDDVLSAHRDYKYKELLGALQGVASTKTIVFTLNPNLKREPQVPEHLKTRFTNQKF